MARIDSQLLFLTTSPRTPAKMIPEIDLLIEHFNGAKWDHETQCGFMEILRNEDFYNGIGANDPAFSARDRINRAPKSLGFVTLSPKIQITPAGKALLNSRNKEEIFLRQMLKFQVPSPYHKPTEKAASFCVKPYLEMLRLVRHLGTLRFDELQIFGMQLTDYHDFNYIVQKIELFRTLKAKNIGKYKSFKEKYLQDELRKIYSTRIANGETKTRESNDASLKKFLKTQSSNTRDYADACFRYLRATGLVNVSHIGKSLSITPARIEDVDYILQTVDRDPCFVDDEYQYIQYLGNAETPRLLTDNKEMIMARIEQEFPEFAHCMPEYEFDDNTPMLKLKDMLADLVQLRKDFKINQEVKEIKDFQQYDEINNTYSQIVNKEIYDAPLMLEYNTWRAMTMIDGGDIHANLNFDDFGKPLSTAAGNMADIVCDYEDFKLTVEVTMATGQKQYDMEGEPVSRHLGKLKKTTDKPCYCLFIAPSINEACIAHFYALHKMNISYYGGKSVIIPLPLEVFRKMVDDSYKAAYTPNSSQVKSIFKYSEEVANTCSTEAEWYELVQKRAINWLKYYQAPEPKMYVAAEDVRKQ